MQAIDNFTRFLVSFSAVELDVAISIHEVVSHLGNTHVVLEGPMVSMNRQLPKEHPIHALFAPHVEGTALINWGADEVNLLRNKLGSP
ncbi:unnamed protein product, partial [Ectocarpus sp. 13 AM-2016]